MDGANQPFTDADSDTIQIFCLVVLNKRKLSAFVLNGNTGQDGLGWEDGEKFGSRDDSFSMNMDDDGNVSYEWAGTQ
jgi:hypothetical protein